MTVPALRGWPRYPDRVTSPMRPVPAGTAADPLSLAWIADLVRATLTEDLGGDPGRDVTSQSTIGPQAVGVAHLVAREAGVVAGLVVVQPTLDDVARRFNLPTTQVTFSVSDGTQVQPGTVLATLHGPIQTLLIAERSLLNLASRASGIATATRRWTDALEGTGAQVLDTRKTTPGLRELEKYAVRCGGGTNKRMGLYDVAMIKDNHIVAAGSVSLAMMRVTQLFPDVTVQVEADTTEQAIEAIEAGARFLLLDNMPDDVLRHTVEAVRALESQFGRVELEATGNLTLPRAAHVANTGVDYLSVGALTHSAPILDLALDLLE